MMEFLQNLVDGSNFPLLTAFLLGLMTAISPCPLATNITATAYLSKDIADKSIPDVTSRFIRDEYFLNMKSLSLSYDFMPDLCRKLYLNRLRVEFLMNDIFRVSTIKQERGLDYPFARSFEFSISAAF